MESDRKDVVDSFAELPMEGTGTGWDTVTVSGSWTINPHLTPLVVTKVATSVFVRVLVLGEGFSAMCKVEIRERATGVVVAASSQGSKAWSLLATLNEGQYDVAAHCTDATCSNSFAVKISRNK